MQTSHVVKNCKTKIYRAPRYQRSKSARRLGGPLGRARARYPLLLPASRPSEGRQNRASLFLVYWRGCVGTSYDTSVTFIRTANPNIRTANSNRPTLFWPVRVCASAAGAGSTSRSEAKSQSQLQSHQTLATPPSKTQPKATGSARTLDHPHYLVANNAQSALISMTSVLFQH